MYFCSLSVNSKHSKLLNWIHASFLLNLISFAQFALYVTLKLTIYAQWSVWVPLFIREPLQVTLLKILLISSFLYIFHWVWRIIVVAQKIRNIMNIVCVFAWGYLSFFFFHDFDEREKNNIKWESSKKEILWCLKIRKDCRYQKKNMNLDFFDKTWTILKTENGRLLGQHTQRVHLRLKIT